MLLAKQQAKMNPRNCNKKLSEMIRVSWFERWSIDIAPQIQRRISFVNVDWFNSLERRQRRMQPIRRCFRRCERIGPVLYRIQFDRHWRGQRTQWHWARSTTMVCLVPSPGQCSSRNISTENQKIGREKCAFRLIAHQMTHDKCYASKPIFNSTYGRLNGIPEDTVFISVLP